MRDMFDADYGMFKLDEETRMYWFRASNIDMSMEFELVGTMIGLAIYNCHLLEFSFPMLTYRSGLGCNAPGVLLVNFVMIKGKYCPLS